MFIAFYIFAGLLVLLSIQSLRGGFRFLDHCRRAAGAETRDRLPFVSVIVPCRGIDEGLSQNLSSVLEFDYPAYEVIFVVDDEADPATEVIKQVSADSRLATKLVVANKAVNSSQKVENLREAVLHAEERSEAFVFVDSDARPSPVSLRHLITALGSETVGAATGYRWFISKKRNIASELRSSWNASIASALGPDTRSNFCWGGSMAIRRETFERLAIRERWSGTLSDDFAVTRAMRAEGLDIVFVPNALTASFGECSFRELLEFTTRQMKITRVYSPKLWILSFFGSSVFCGVMITSIVFLFLRETWSFAFLVAVVMLIVVSICSTAKAWLRTKAVSLALTEHRDLIERQFLSQITLWAATPFIFLYNSVAASVSRRINWRGTTYELKSPTETVIIAD